MGNAFLKEMKDYASQQEKIDKNLARRSLQYRNLKKGTNAQYAFKKLNDRLEVNTKNGGTKTIMNDCKGILNLKMKEGNVIG